MTCQSSKEPSDPEGGATNHHHYQGHADDHDHDDNGFDNVDDIDGHNDDGVDDDGGKDDNAVFFNIRNALAEVLVVD